MDREAERLAVDVTELDRQAGIFLPETSQAPFSVQSGRENKHEPEPEAA
jgi:hypothetical protein